MVLAGARDTAARQKMKARKKRARTRPPQTETNLIVWNAALSTERCGCQREGMRTRFVIDKEKRGVEDGWSLLRTFDPEEGPVYETLFLDCVSNIDLLAYIECSANCTRIRGAESIATKSVRAGSRGK
jgi:hypothetical protein